MSERCEPADPNREQWGWLRTPTHGPVLCRWSEHRGVAGDWRWHYQGARDGDINPAFISELGWQYVSSVPSPAELAALLRCFLPFQMAMAESDLIGDDVPDDQVIIHFSGSGASDQVTAGMLRAALAPFQSKDTPDV